MRIVSEWVRHASNGIKLWKWMIISKETGEEALSCSQQISWKVCSLLLGKGREAILPFVFETIHLQNQTNDSKRFQLKAFILKGLPSWHYFCLSCRRFVSHVRSDAAHDEDPHTAARAWEPPRHHWPRPLGPQVRRQVQGRKTARRQERSLSSRWTLLIIILSTTSPENQFDQSCVTVR